MSDEAPGVVTKATSASARVLTRTLNSPSLTAIRQEEPLVQPALEDPSHWDDEERARYDEDGRLYSAEGEGFDLEERQALRRVAGLATELTDVTEVEYRQLRLERVVLIGVWTSGSAVDAENSLTELAALAETAGSQVLEGLVQR